jgi:hypothetical protein
MRYVMTKAFGPSRQKQTATALGMLRSLLGSLVMLSLPAGAGAALTQLASALACRLPVLLPALARRYGLAAMLARPPTLPRRIFNGVHGVRPA